MHINGEDEYELTISSHLLAWEAYHGALVKLSIPTKLPRIPESSRPGGCISTGCICVDIDELAARLKITFSLRITFPILASTSIECGQYFFSSQSCIDEKSQGCRKRMERKPNTVSVP
jgi:hypothetical protein